MPTKTVVEQLVIEIGGDSRKFKSELKNLQQAERGFEGTMKNMAVIGKASFLAIGAAATTLGVVATKAFADFETGITNVAKTTNLQGQELEDFKDEIISLSEAIPVTTDKLLEIATAAGQLGIKGAANLTKFTEVIAKLGRTTNVDGEEAALTIARLLNLTNESIQSVDKLGSTLVDLGNNFAASEAEILEVSKDVAKATVQFKLSSSEILGISAAMASLGIAAEAGGTVVGKAFQSIDKAIRDQGGPAFEKIIELTGLTGDALTETFAEDASKVFEMFIQGLGKAGQEGKDLTSEMSALGLSGIRVNKILPSLASRSDILADAMKRAGIASKDASALNEEAAKAFATTSSQLQIAQTKINNTLIALGEQIAPNAIEGITLLSDAVRQSKPLWDVLGKSLAVVAKGFSNIIRFMSAAIELGNKNVAAFSKEVREEAKENEKFLLKELKKRGITRSKFNRINRKNRRDAAKVRKKEVEKSEKAVTKIVKKEGDNRVDEAVKTKERLLEIERSSLEGIRRVNEAEIALATAQRQGASQQEIDQLQRKFDSIKRITRLEQSILKIQNQEHISAIEQEQIDHSSNLLAIEQANYDDLINEQAEFQGVSRQEFKDYREDTQDYFNDNPINIPVDVDDPTGTGTTGGDTGGGTDTGGDTDGGGGTTEIVIDEGELGPLHMAEKARCEGQGKDYNPKIGQYGTCCAFGYFYDGNGSCLRGSGTTAGTGDTGTTGSGDLYKPGQDYTGDTGCAGEGASPQRIPQSTFNKPAGWSSSTYGSLAVWQQPCCSGLSQNQFGDCTGSASASFASPSASLSSPSISSNLPSSSIQQPTVSSPTSPTGTTATGTQPIYIEIAFADGAIDFITAKQVEKSTLGI